VALRLRRQQANGARYEDTRVDRRTAFCGVARGSANVTNTTATRCKRPKKQFDTHQHRRYLPGGNGRDVLQCGHRPEQRGLRDAWRPARLLLLSRPVEKVWCLRTSCATEAIRFEAHIAVPLTTRRLEGCPMTTCPICRSEAAALPKTGDADGFDCHEHGKFKVASSVFATKNPNREQWEAALKRAETRQPDAWAPVILIDDFR
jgi:hypothetical protein